MAFDLVLMSLLVMYTELTILNIYFVILLLEKCLFPRGILQFFNITAINVFSKSRNKLFYFMFIPTYQNETVPLETFYLFKLIELGRTRI